MLYNLGNNKEYIGEGRISKWRNYEGKEGRRQRREEGQREGGKRQNPPFFLF